MIFHKFRFKFIILSVILLTISSGLLFYRQLFLDEIKSESVSKTDLEELRYLDQQINISMYEMRMNLNISSDEILKTKNRITDLLNIILDIRKNNNELRKSLSEVKGYFEEKDKSIDNFLIAIREIQANLKSLNPTYIELQKANIKFTLDGKDFYRECISDTLLYLVNPAKEVEWKFNEDIKILTQILGFSKVPNPIVDKYYKTMENVRKKSREIESILLQAKEKNISSQMTVVMRFDNDVKDTGHSRGQTFLYLVFSSIVLYVGIIIFVLFKL